MEWEKVIFAKRFSETIHLAIRVGLRCADDVKNLFGFIDALEASPFNTNEKTQTLKRIIPKCHIKDMSKEQCVSFLDLIETTYSNAGEHELNSITGVICKTVVNLIGYLDEEAAIKICEQYTYAIKNKTVSKHLVYLASKQTHSGTANSHIYMDLVYRLYCEETRSAKSKRIAIVGSFSNNLYANPLELLQKLADAIIKKNDAIDLQMFVQAGIYSYTDSTIPILDYLRTKGVDVITMKFTTTHSSFLQQAVCYANPYVVKYALSHDCDVNEIDKHDMTALMYAATFGSKTKTTPNRYIRDIETDIVQQLVAAGGDLSIVSKKGLTALDYAMINGSQSDLYKISSKAAFCTSVDEVFYRINFNQPLVLTRGGTISVQTLSINGAQTFDTEYLYFPQSNSLVFSQPGSINNGKLIEIKMT